MELTTKKRVFELCKVDYHGNGRKTNLVTIDIRLSGMVGKPAFSASGGIWNNKTGQNKDYETCGQCLARLLEYKEVAYNKTYQEIYELWSEYHLNDQNAGTVRQERALKKAGITNNNYSYDKALAYLESNGLNEEYKYGSEWLYRAIPDDDLQRIYNLFNPDLWS